jgi:hypothetical protein
MTISAQAKRHERWIKGQERLEYEGNIETLAATKTLKVTDPIFQKLDPGGSGRTVLLPPEAGSEHKAFFIYNAEDVGGDLTVKDDSDTNTIGTVAFGSAGTWFGCNGTAWEAM